MNIFYIDRDPVKAAQALADKHVYKMGMESFQMLSGVVYDYISLGQIEGIPKPPGYYNHPCTVWARSSKKNASWLFLHGIAIFEEHKYRKGTIHSTWQKLLDIGTLMELGKNDIRFLKPPPRCMPEEFWADTTLESYRNYYRIGKKHLHQWTRRTSPYWL